MPTQAEADRQVIAQHDLGGHLRQIVGLIDDEEREMQQQIEERRHPDHAAHIHQRRIAGDPPQRRYEERQE